jgi:hypothetical protein
VVGRRRLGDVNHPIDVVDVAPSPHLKELLAVWLPSARILYEADVLDPTGPEGQPMRTNGDDARALAKALVRLGIDVGRIVPTHGRLGTKADLDFMIASRP